MNAATTLQKPLFTYQNGHKDYVVTHVHSLEKFDADVLRQNEVKSGIRTVCDMVSSMDGVELDNWKAIPLYNLETKVLTGYQLIEIKGETQPIAVGTGLPVIHLNNKHTTCLIATDNFSLFLRLDKLNYTAVYHCNVHTAYEALNAYLDDSKPRIIATNKQLNHAEDLKVHFDADVSKLTDKEIKERLQAKALGIKADALEQAENAPQAATWGEITPLDSVQADKSQPYPVHALPPLLQNAAKAIAEYVQAPIAMTAQCVIGAVAHIAQAHVNAPSPHNTNGEPCSLFLLTEGQSGSRKSSSKSLADKAINEHERQAYDLYKDAMQQWKNMQAGLSKKDREAFIVENPPPNDPSTLFSDSTLEALEGLYVDGALFNASISSDEAAQFFGGHTMKGDTRTQALGGFTKLFDDGSIQRTRSKSNLNGSGRAFDVRLTFNLQGQREVLADALNDNVLREQGFLPRFILTVPENLAGTRLQGADFNDRTANQDHRLIAYWERSRTLLDPCPMPLVDGQQSQDRRVIQLNDDATIINLAFYNECEREQAKDGKYEHIQGFASRASQLARRVATVFAYFQNEPEITAKTMQGACDIIRHSLNEWLRYADIETRKESDAQKLLKWLVNRCMKELTDRIAYSTVQTSCPRPMQKNKALLEMTAQQLEDTNYIKIEFIFKSRYVLLNPLLLRR